MKKVILEIDNNTVLLKDVKEDVPIFAKTKDGKLDGMVICSDEKEWSLALGKNYHSNGHHPSRDAVIKSNYQYDYEFFVEED